MSRPRILDLFCGAGGAGMGYHRAGFDVVGVDIEPQPRYPFKFWQHDALRFLALDEPQDIASSFDAIHASPPCQHYTTMNNRYPDVAARHPDLIGPTKELMRRTGLPFVVENVGGARRKLSHPVVLCARALGAGVGRHRWFECDGFHCHATGCRCDGSEPAIYGKPDGRRVWTRADGTEMRAVRTVDQAREAMGIDWMDWGALGDGVLVEPAGRVLAHSALLLGLRVGAVDGVLRVALRVELVLRPDSGLAAYIAIVEAERACRRAHDLCYGPDRRANGATYWLTTRLGKCQSILMHYVVKHAGWYEKRLG